MNSVYNKQKNLNSYLIIVLEHGQCELAQKYDQQGSQQLVESDNAQQLSDPFHYISHTVSFLTEYSYLHWIIHTYFRLFHPVYSTPLALLPYPTWSCHDSPNHHNSLRFILYHHQNLPLYTHKCFLYCNSNLSSNLYFNHFLHYLPYAKFIEIYGNKKWSRLSTSLSIIPFPKE